MARRYHLHPPGLAYLAVTVVVGLAAINKQNNLLFWALGLMVGALLVSGIVSGWMMQVVGVQRLVPRHGIVGEPLTVRYAVTNRSRLMPVFNVHVEERPAGTGGWARLMRPARAWVMHVGPRETVHGEAVFWPLARGEAGFDRLRVSTTFPFGLVRKSITFSRPQHTLVHPLLYEVRRQVVEAVVGAGFSGAVVSTRPPEPAGDEYYGLREFRPGDSMRHIAWKRSATADQLVCIERTRPAPPRLRVILNLTGPTGRRRAVPDRAGARALEERAISLAASIVHVADLQGFEVGVSLPGTGQPSLPIRRGHWHREKIMAALAEIDLDARREPGESRGGPRAERAGQIVVHPDRIEPGLAREDAWHLSARQLESLIVRPPAWDPLAAAVREAPA